MQPATERRPIHPYIVLLAAIVLPGSGYVLAGEPKRGFTMQMFMIVFAIVTWHLAPAGASIVGKLAGGLFLYALSIPESYRIARLKWDAFAKRPVSTESRRDAGQ